MWGEPVGPGGYLDAELLDGRRGLVPSHFVQRLIGMVDLRQITYYIKSGPFVFKVTICLNSIKLS